MRAQNVSVMSHLSAYTNLCIQWKCAKKTKKIGITVKCLFLQDVKEMYYQANFALLNKNNHSVKKKVSNR